MEENYQPQIIEENAQVFWESQGCFEANESDNKEKFYCLAMFPYPSGYLHMGHVRNYTLGDVIARYQRMQKKNVMQPSGWDAFGLPAENAAIQHKIPPAVWTYKNIDYMRTQFKRLGLAYDWRREITTCDPDYYRWEQWFFLQLYKKGLVYKKSAEVNWDPVDQTVLANEQVIDGRGWRSGALVERREIPQWFFKITAYAEELLSGLDQLPHWPEQVKTMQRNWIGKSEGIEIDFGPLHVFTTRPDTLFGVTYLAIAPQHPLAKKAAEKNPAVQKFLEECKNIKVAEADFATLPKKGVKLDLYGIHPITQKQIPIWVANFVLMEYGSGALMAVPAHDQRDFEFAKQYQLPIEPVIVPADQTPWDFNQSALTAPGVLIHSEQFSGMSSQQAVQAINDLLEKEKKGKRRINYRLRDWGVSRQRYWGTPIPIIYCKNCEAQPVPEKDLPVRLPEDIKNPAFLHTTCPKCGGPAERETDTFDTFFESSWYYARFACPDLKTAMLDKRADYWLPVDQYIGGIEHAVMHLLYARFIHKTLRDQGLVKSNEPFLRLLTQGMVLNQGIKMSKSKGNTVEPKPLIDKYGADTVRLFVMFAAPPEQNLEWSDAGVEGAYRFLKRLWTFAYQHREQIQKTSSSDLNSLDAKQKDLVREMYEIVQQANYDYERLQLNTIVSSCMKLFNLLQKTSLPDFILRLGMQIILYFLSPIAPHITHQLWRDLQFEGLVLNASLPEMDAAQLKIESIEYVVQINGKLRSHISAPVNATKEQLEEIAKQDHKVQHTLTNKTIKKIITVPGKLINIVAEEN